MKKNLYLNHRCSNTEKDSDEELALLDREKVSLPKLYNVILHNDDYTTMEFVVYILKTVFNKSVEEANLLMLEIHKRGKAVSGTYTYEIAETKVACVHKEAQLQGHPLKSTFEPA